MEKNGLSTVITSLILIFLVLVALSIFWVVIRNVFSENIEEVGLEKFTIGLDITSASIVSPTTIDVGIKRKPGKGNLVKVIAVFENPSGKETIEQPISLLELEEKTLTFTVADSSVIETVEIYPVYETSSSGKEITGNLADESRLTGFVCVGDIDCDDSLFCNGVETCDIPTGTCQAGTPPTMDDGVSCTLDSCDEVNDVIVHTPDNSICEDGLFCTINICEVVLDCQSVNGACTNINVCDEAGDICYTPTNLISMWKFDDGTATDEQGVSNGVIIGATSNPTGGYNNLGAFDYNGLGNKIEFSSAPYNFDTNDPFSVSIWFKHGTFSDGQTDMLISKTIHGGVFPGWEILMIGDPLDAWGDPIGSVRISFGSSVDIFCLPNCDNYAETTVSGGFNDGLWHHLVITHDTTANGFEIWIDGNNMLTTVDWDGLTGSTLSPAKLTLGQRDGLTDNTFSWEGSIDDVRIYDKTLTGIEVQDLFNT